MTSKSVNFNDLKGDNLTEIISYLHPHTEENKRLKEELKKYMEFEKWVIQFIEREYEREDLTDIPHKRKFPRKKIESEETHKNLLDIHQFTNHKSYAAKKRFLERKIKGRKRAIAMKIDEKQRILNQYNQTIKDYEDTLRKYKGEFDKLDKLF